MNQKLQKLWGDYFPLHMSNEDSYKLRYQEARYLYQEWDGKAMEEKLQSNEKLLARAKYCYENGINPTKWVLTGVEPHLLYLVFVPFIFAGFMCLEGVILQHIFLLPVLVATLTVCLLAFTFMLFSSRSARKRQAEDKRVGEALCSRAWLRPGDSSDLADRVETFYRKPLSRDLQALRRKNLQIMGHVTIDLRKPYLEPLVEKALATELKRLRQEDDRLLQEGLKPQLSAASKKLLLEAHFYDEAPQELTPGVFEPYPLGELEAAPVEVAR